MFLRQYTVGEDLENFFVSGFGRGWGWGGFDLSEFDAFMTRMNDLIFRHDFFAFFVKTDCKFGNTRLICIRGICLIGGFHLVCSSIAYDYFVILSIAKTLFN